HLIDKVLIMCVDRARKVHDVPGVAIGERREHENLVRHLSTGPARDFGRADDVYVERQVWAMLFDRAAWHDAYLAQFDRVIDLGPRELFVPPFGFRTTHGVSSENLCGDCSIDSRIGRNRWRAYIR